jgi:hypothetical protein
LSFSVLFKSSPLRGGFFIFSSIGEAVKKLWHTEKEFNCTPHFCSLPQGREGRKENDFNGTFHFNYFSLGKKVKKISSRASSPLTGEDRGGGEKVNSTPHPDPVL